MKVCRARRCVSRDGFTRITYVYDLVGLRCIANKCPNLEVFRVESCDNISDDVVRDVTKSCRFLREVRA